MSQCLSASVSRCLSVSMSQCRSVSMSQCLSVSISQCLNVSVSQCLTHEIPTKKCANVGRASRKYDKLFSTSAKQCKGVHCVDLGESFQTHIFLQILASIQPITSTAKSGRFSAKFAKSKTCGASGGARPHPCGSNAAMASLLGDESPSTAGRSEYQRHNSN